MKIRIKVFFQNLKKINWKSKVFMSGVMLEEGKTLITNTFLSLLKYKIASYHYIDFMEYIHSG